jgi:2-phospho-L-lactate guanylyltransferase
MTGWVIVPVKSLVNGKSRLAAVLSPAERRRFNETALAHVLATVREGFETERLLVVSGCAESRRFVLAHGAEAIEEPAGGGLNLAIRYARDHAMAHGAERILVIASDLPRVTADEIRTVNRHACEGISVVICRDRRRTGTNALLLSGAGDFRFAFGDGSAAAHAAEAVRCGHKQVPLDLPGLGFDIDTPDDLKALNAPA